MKKTKNENQLDIFNIKVLKTIEKYSMLSSGDSILIGVSGGADSVALLLSLIDIINAVNISHTSFIKNKASLKDGLLLVSNVGVAHINHCLRGQESDQDEAFVIRLAQQYNLPYEILKTDVPAFAKANKLSFEEAARNIRYDFFTKTAEQENYRKIALAHNSDDNAELVLMNLLRGSGTKGIAGIPPFRSINHSFNTKHDKTIIRPLIEISREEILEYLKIKQQEYRVDSSNNDTHYLRNRIRHNLIPGLKDQYNPSIVDSLNRLSRITADEESWMKEETERIFNKLLISSDKSYKEIEIKIKYLKELHQALLKRIIRRAVKEVKQDLRRITLQHIDDIQNLIFSKSSGQNLHLPDKILIIKKKESICFKKESISLRKLQKR